jgi:GNAT superfamily N-acetyltransferase
MEFRKAKLNDVDELVTLRKQQLLDEGFNPVQNIDIELKEYFSENIVKNTFIAWLAVENNEIVGTSGLCFYKLPPNYSNPSGKIAYITNMYTKNKFRRKGIATKLLERIIDEAKSLNYIVIRLLASLEGKNLYIKYGFKDHEGNMQINI